MKYAIQNAMLHYWSLCITILTKGGSAVGFQLKPNRKETENKTIRFPIPLIERINKAIQDKDTSFSSFVIQACDYVLKDMEK